MFNISDKVQVLATRETGTVVALKNEYGGYISVRLDKFAGQPSFAFCFRSDELRKLPIA